MEPDFLVFDNLINQDEIIKINNFIDKNYDFLEPQENSAKTSNNISKKLAEVKVITLKKLNKLINTPLELMYDVANQNYGYNLFPKNENNTFLLSKYTHENKSKYDYHIDKSESPHYDAKLTFIINISFNKFEGGNFSIFNGNEYEIEKLTKSGNAILFKSHLNHKVSPIILGERRSLTYFMSGPKFK